MQSTVNGWGGWIRTNDHGIKTHAPIVDWRAE